MEASAEERSGYLDFSKVSPGEFMGMGAALVLLASLWLPWFTTSSDNPNSKLPGGVSGGDSASAWQVFGMLDWLLVARVRRSLHPHLDHRARARPHLEAGRGHDDRRDRRLHADPL